MAPSLHIMKTNVGTDQVYGFPNWLKRHEGVVNGRPGSMHCVGSYKEWHESRENMKLAQMAWSAKMFPGQSNQTERQSQII